MKDYETNLIGISGEHLLTVTLNRPEEAYDQLVDTADRREGVPAFNEKRKSLFDGEQKETPPWL
jgi:hypothetical protein